MNLYHQGNYTVMKRGTDKVKIIPNHKDNEYNNMQGIEKTYSNEVRTMDMNRMNDKIILDKKAEYNVLVVTLPAWDIIQFEPIIYKGTDGDKICEILTVPSRTYRFVKAMRRNYDLFD